MIHVELADQNGPQAQPSTHAVELRTSQGEPWGVWSAASNLAVEPLPPASAPVGRVVVWSGWLGEEAFERHPGTWMPAGLAALNEGVDQWLASADSAGRRLLLRPHARHVLCDPQRCFSFFTERDGQPIGLALDPPALIEDSMQGIRAEHYDRMFEALGPRCDAVWLAGDGRDDEIRARVERWCAGETALIAPPAVPAR